MCRNTPWMMMNPRYDYYNIRLLINKYKQLFTRAIKNASVRELLMDKKTKKETSHFKIHFFLA